MRGALLWLGRADPVETMEEIREADPKRSQMQAVAASWREAFGHEQVTAAQVIKKAIEQRRADTYESHFEFVSDNLREALMVVAGRGGAINSRALGEWLSASKTRSSTAHASGRWERARTSPSGRWLMMLLWVRWVRLVTSSHAYESVIFNV